MRSPVGLALGALILSACQLGMAPSVDSPPSDSAAEAQSPAPLIATPPRGRLLAQMTWYEAEVALAADTVVVIPVGATLKEHGPHLLLQNDWLMAEYYKDRVLLESDVIVVPTIGYHYYPAFTEYPGSTTLRESTARDLMVDIVRSLAAYGPRRFYVLNTGVSTVGPLQSAADLLAKEGILLHYTDLPSTLKPIEASVSEQEGGTHADEIETSIMLYIAPGAVKMRDAVEDYAPKTRKGFSRSPEGPGHYSKTGVWGNPTLATRKKGEVIVEAMVQAILADIEALRKAEPPRGTPNPATDYPFGAPL